jgi:hypothetical protein
MFFLASSSQHFEESWCLHVWGQVRFLACLIQKMKTLQSFKMPQATHAMTNCHIPEDLNKVADVSQVLVLYCLEECEYRKIPILHCCILVLCNLFTSCTVPLKCPNNVPQILCFTRSYAILGGTYKNTKSEFCCTFKLNQSPI